MWKKGYLRNKNLQQLAYYSKNDINDNYFFAIWTFSTCKTNIDISLLYFNLAGTIFVKCLPRVGFEYLDIWIEDSYIWRKHSSSPLAAFALGTKKGVGDSTIGWVLVKSDGQTQIQAEKQMLASSLSFLEFQVEARFYKNQREGAHVIHILSLCLDEHLSDKLD